MKYFVLQIIVGLSIISIVTSFYHLPKDKKVILILADGVRYDYVKDKSLTGFSRMAKNGVKAEYVQPIFPSNSYPNWYTIVTGKFYLTQLNNNNSNSKLHLLFSCSLSLFSRHSFCFFSLSIFRSCCVVFSGCKCARTIRPCPCSLLLYILHNFTSSIFSYIYFSCIII